MPLAAGAFWTSPSRLSLFYKISPRACKPQFSQVVSKFRDAWKWLTFPRPFGKVILHFLYGQLPFFDSFWKMSWRGWPQ
jgi:hypothetical protein